MPAFFLAIVLLAHPGTAPEIVAGFKSEDACVRAAMHSNASPQMQTPQAKADDATFVCLAVVRSDY